MDPTAQFPRSPRSNHPDPVRSLSALLVLAVMAIALVAPKVSSAQDIDGWVDGSSMLPGALSKSEIIPCDSTAPSAFGGAPHAFTLQLRIVTLGPYETATRDTLDPSAFLVRVEANGRGVTPVCSGMRFLEIGLVDETAVTVAVASATARRREP